MCGGREQPGWHWTGQELQESGAWLIDLGGMSAHEALGAADERFAADSAPVDDESARSPGRVCIDSVIAEDLYSKLTNGPGLAVITGRVLADSTDDQLRSFTLEMSRTLGTLRPQDRQGSEIKDIRQAPANAGQDRGFDSTERMLMHSDAADFAGLMCLRPGRHGGESTLCSSSALHALLRDTHPDLLQLFHRPWTWDLDNVRHESAPRTFRGPIFSLHGDTLSCRFGSHFLKSGLQFDPSADQQRLAALKTFEEAATDPTLLFEHKLGRGDSLWVNNQHVLHGRRAYTSEGSDGERHLLRTWISTPSPILDPKYRAFDDHIFGASTEARGDRG